MTPEQLRIAEAAVKAKKRTAIPDLQSQIVDAIGIDRKEIQRVLALLTREGFLRMCTTPVANIAAGEDAHTDPTDVWYEKGDRWKR